jgi:hypothetical protein
MTQATCPPLCKPRPTWCRRLEQKKISLKPTLRNWGCPPPWSSFPARSERKKEVRNNENREACARQRVGTGPAEKLSLEIKFVQKIASATEARLKCVFSWWPGTTVMWHFFMPLLYSKKNHEKEEDAVLKRWPSCTHDLATGTQILVFNPSTGSTLCFS